MMKFLLALCTLSLTVTACNTSRHTISEYSMPLAETASPSAEPSEKFIHFNLDREAQVERKVQYSANLDLKVASPDSAAQQLTALALRLGGYVQTTGTDFVTIRIPQAHFHKAIDTAESLGKLESKYIYGEDVTAAYYDLHVRLDNSEKARQRYLELLARAENVEAALQVERELERLNAQIESYKGQLKLTDHLVAFSTLSVTLKERKKPGLLGYVGLGLYHGVKWLFVRN